MTGGSHAGASGLAPHAGPVGLGALVAAIVVSGFDLDWRITTLDGARIRPLHALSLLAAAAALVLRRPDRVVWGVLVALLGMLAAAAASARVDLTSQPVVDLAVVFLITIATLTLVSDQRTARLLLAAAAVAAVAVGIVAAIAHFGDSDAIFGSRYRGRITRLHGEPRLTRPLLHANVAAMYLGPLAVGALATTAYLRGRLQLLAALVAGALVMLATLTASRAAIIAIAVTTLAIGAVVGRRLAGVLGMVVIMAIATAWMVSPALQGRTSSDDRYLAEVTGPGDFDLSATRTLTVEVTNRSSTTWPASGDEKVVLTARWRDDSQAREWLSQVWPLSETMRPGDRTEVTVRVPVQVPDGSYVVVWDLLLDRRAFFLESQGIQETSQVQVSGSDIDTLASEAVKRTRPSPTRPTVWRWAIELFADRPMLGHGPGAMRFAVTDIADTSTVLPASHAHNLVLEPLASWGLVGAAVTLSLLAVLVASLLRRWGRGDLVGLTSGAMLLTMVLHGAVEWPWGFPSLGVVFGMAAGIWTRSARGEIGP